MRMSRYHIARPQDRAIRGGAPMPHPIRQPSPTLSL
jgi:hypothetical protein